MQANRRIGVHAHWRCRPTHRVTAGCASDSALQCVARPAARRCARSWFVLATAARATALNAPRVALRTLLRAARCRTRRVVRCALRRVQYAIEWHARHIGTQCDARATCRGHAAHPLSVAAWPRGIARGADQPQLGGCDVSLYQISNSASAITNHESTPSRRPHTKAPPQATH